MDYSKIVPAGTPSQFQSQPMTNKVTLWLNFISPRWCSNSINLEPIILVDGACKNGKGAIGGVIMKEANPIISWSSYIGCCHTSEYADKLADKYALNASISYEW